MMRRGFILPEVMTALVLTGIVAGALFAMVRTQVRLVSAGIERTSRADALRVASLVIGAETRAAAPADIHGIGPDSLAVRIFRGTGIVCAHENDVTHMRYRGFRQPDPVKDSVLIADTDEVISVSGYGSMGRPCGTGEVSLGLRLGGAPQRVGTVLLVFETGTYHFSTRALRFRRGNEGRQPITDEMLDDAHTGFTPSGSAFSARITLRAGQRAATPFERALVVFPSLNR